MIMVMMTGIIMVQIKGEMMMSRRIYIYDCQAGTAALQLRQVGDQVGTARLTIMISTIITINHHSRYYHHHCYQVGTVRLTIIPFIVIIIADKGIIVVIFYCHFHSH